MNNSRVLTAEAVGTFILMIGGPGSAILAADSIGRLGVAFAFGFSLLVAAYAIGPISGCHINPAVTLGLAVMRKVEMAKVPFYVAGQLIGAAIGGALLYLIVEVRNNEVDDTGILATNQWGADLGFAGFGAMAIVEVVFTGLLVFVVLSTTSRKFEASQIGVTVGLALALIHLVTIPIDNTSVNPVRSFGVAIFEGGDALEQLWAFILFPLVGAIFGVLLWLAVDDAELEDTLLGDSPLTDIRDAAGDVIDKAADVVDDVID